jgi:hypothetical protein
MARDAAYTHDPRTPPRTACAPTTWAKCVGASTPLCRGTTHVFGPTTAGERARHREELPRVHAHYAHIPDADLGRVIGRQPGLDHAVPVGALHPPSVAGERVEMVPTGKPGPLRSRLRQPPTHRGPHRPGTKNGQAPVTLPDKGSKHDR